MGVWGAAQAGAFAVGGFLGAAGVGVLRVGFHQTAPAFLIVFCAEGVVFLIAAVLAGGLHGRSFSEPRKQAERSAPLEFGGAPV
jgi:BCD family chlorophyll transporter-like MFS transporter